MPRRSPLPLIPLAFLTLACGQPVGGVALPDASEAPSTQLVASRLTAPPAKPAKKERAKKTVPVKDDGAAPAGSIRFGRKTAPPKKPGALRLAAYNLENLFDDKDDPTISGDIDDATMTTPPARLAGLAAAIKELDADVLAVEEVESKEALLQFRDGYLTGLGYEFVESVDAGDRRGIEQAVLSRVPIVAVHNWPQEDITDMRAKETGTGWSTPVDGKWPQRWARSPLEVELKTKEGYELTLFVVHHKSGKDFDAQRELEGLQVVEFVHDVLGRRPNCNVAILGDFNATPKEKSIAVYVGSGLGLTTAYDKRFDKRAPREMYITHVTSRPIDYIFMSPGLAEDAIDGSFFVLGTIVGPDRAPIDAPKPAGYASDHFPIAVDLTPDVVAIKPSKT